MVNNTENGFGFNPISALFKNVPPVGKNERTWTSKQYPIDDKSYHSINYNLISLEDMRFGHRLIAGISSAVMGVTAIFSTMELVTGDPKTAAIFGSIGGLLASGILGTVGRNNYKKYKTAYTEWQQTGSYTKPINYLSAWGEQTLYKGNHNGGSRSL